MNRDNERVEETAKLIRETIEEIVRQQLEAMLPELKEEIKSELREEVGQRASLAAIKVQEEITRQAVINAGLGGYKPKAGHLE